MLPEVLENVKEAIRNGRTDIVRSLIAATECYDLSGIQNDLSTEKIINTVHMEEGTFLHFATALSQADIVRTLLAAGADPGIQNGKGQTSIELAVSPSMQAVYTEELLKATAQTNIGRVCQLVAAGISINSPDSPKSGNTALHWAATFANRDMVQCLIDRSAEINALNACGATPLHDAVHRGDLDIVEELLQHGANPLIRATKGKFSLKTPLDLAENSTEILSLLMKYSMNFTNGSVHDTSLSQSKKSSSLESLLSVVQDQCLPSVEQRLSLLSSSEKETLTDAFTLTDGLGYSEVTSPKCLVTESKLKMLWPQPRYIEQLDGAAFKLAETIPVYIITGPDQSAASAMLEEWECCQLKTSLPNGVAHSVDGILPSSASVADNCVSCHINAHIFPSSCSYKITVQQHRVSIVASDSTGFHYAVTTYLQLLRLFSEERRIPQLIINDWPTLQHRAVLLDMSARGRVPTLETLMCLATTLSSLKISHLHFYIKFSAHTSWQISYTKREMMELDRHCQKFHVNIVPALDIEPNVTFDELMDLFSSLEEFLACFSNLRYVHIGPYICRLLIDPNCVTSPLEELSKLLPVPSHITLMLCCNAFHSDSELLRVLPPNVILLEYGFQASYNFSSVCQSLTRTGACFGVVPGTATWNSITGSPEAALHNLYQGSQCIIADRGFGMIVADWCGMGILPFQVFSWPGFTITAGLAWNCSTSLDFIHSNLAEIMNCHVFQDKGESFGQAVVEFGYAETTLLRASRAQDISEMTDLPAADGTPLHQLLTQPDNLNLEHLTIENFQKAVKHIKNCHNLLTKADLLCPQGTSITAELQLAIDCGLMACRLGRALIMIGQNPNASMGVAVINLGITNLVPTTRTDFANSCFIVIRVTMAEEDEDSVTDMVQVPKVEYEDMKELVRRYEELREPYRQALDEPKMWIPEIVGTHRTVRKCVATAQPKIWSRKRSPLPCNYFTTTNSRKPGLTSSIYYKMKQYSPYYLKYLYRSYTFGMLSIFINVLYNYSLFKRVSN